MSDMHVLTGDGHRWQIVMHFSVPAGHNIAGVPWSTALIDSRLGGITVLVDSMITPAEKTDIEAGTVLEHIATYLVESGGELTSDIRASLREFYMAEKADILARLSKELKYFGLVESEV